MKKKKVIHIVEAFGGGIFAFLVDLVNHTSDEYDITIVYSLRNQTPENFKKYFNSDVKFICVEEFTRKINLINDFKALKEIKKIIKEIQPDIVHLHSSKAGVIGRWACNCKKIKVIYNPHGFSFLMQDSSKLKRILYWWIEKICALRNATIVGCSDGEYKEALKLSKNSICINNSINIEEIENKMKSFKEKILNLNELKICTSGRIGYQKNPRLFNKIAEGLPNVQFTWIGDGELKNTLTSKNIKITGWKNRDEVLELVNENDIFILTSLWEGLPIALLEAMYLKKICIVTDCIGNRDVIKNGINGFIIKDESCREIINKIDEATYSRISSNAKNDVICLFNVELMISKYKELYLK